MITIETIRNKLATDDLWVCRGIVAIYRLQTADEKSTQSTSIDNGMGFNGVDAPFGSSLAVQYLERGSLSTKQTACARKMIRKYAGQLLRIAQAKQTAQNDTDALEEQRIADQFPDE